ncbi:putative ribosomal protein S4/S9 [Helianthus annuus]|nr:hypothetical protein LK184_mgp21 [Helianthus occidentalis]YP_010191868.1 hypothetical protein LK292_mgp23 [Helianthus tuberosus]YP_010736339.1 hypothetical protein P8546_mgp15 [Helianthus argophyllus]KAJ0427304.1 putative ribosomal protein S4/S9 [Helianthus annuus]UBT13009.1 hypothetical protein [Helianthus strumosus]KAJ0467110.1 putative ribosomal protein S4/S9 [Helianthus annuus]KAJ0819023.1 putative ribosomal protein S4/S9 [Helianthus annuus]KAJ0852404.1 putative ribosomal protein S4/S
MPALRFKTCRLLEGNVWNRELTIIQRRILRRLRNKTRSVKRMIYSRKNLNSYILFAVGSVFLVFSASYFPWGFKIYSFFMGLHRDLRCIIFSLLFSCALSLFKWRSYFQVYYGSLFLWIFLLIVAGGISHPVIAWCDAGNPSPPLSPPGQPLPQPETPPAPAPVPVVIPQLPQPLLSDEERSRILYQRYLINNWGGNDDLGRMVSTINAQLLVERYVEAALVSDGFHPQAILNEYRDIRGSLHSPQGHLLSVRTYESYVTQIRELGTRESVPYRRVLRAINHDLLLPRRIGNRWV